MFANTFFRRPLYFRHLSTVNTATNIITNNAKPNNFVPIYKFPYIRVVSLVNRLKLYQTVLSAVTLPSSVVLYNTSFISADTLIFTWVFGLTGIITMFMAGVVPNKFVGFVYLNKKDNIVKLSHLDSWGARKDVEFPLVDLVPVSDLPVIMTDPIYLTLRRFSNKQVFKINFRYGMVLDKAMFKQVFIQDVK